MIAAATPSHSTDVRARSATKAAMIGTAKLHCEAKRPTYQPAGWTPKALERPSMALTQIACA